jgi:hypothetical protein
VLIGARKLEIEMAKRNSLFNVVADAANGLVTVTAEGRVVRIAVSDLAPAMLIQAAVHGIKQKVSDAGAVSADETTGKVDPAEKVRRVFEMAERIVRGVWNERAAAGTSDDMILFRALCAAYPDKTSEQVGRYMEGLDAQKKRILLNQRENNPLAAFVDKVRAELAASAPVDAETLLENFE